MHSYLFLGSNLKTVENKINEFSLSINAQVIDYECQNIEQVRDIKHATSLSFPTITVVYLPSIDNASAEAQNALLKTLEEPRKNIIFALSATNEGEVLPTIISRCEVRRVNSPVSDEDIEYFNEFFKLSVGGKLKMTSEISSREDAIAFLERLINGGSVSLNQNPNYYAILESGQTALERIKGNGNVQIQLTNFVVQPLSKEHN